MNLTIIDIILVVILVVSVIIGVKKGFVAIITAPIKVILSASLTYTFSAEIISGWSGPYFTDLIFTRVREYLTVNCPDITSAETVEALPSVLKLAVTIFDIDFSSAEGAAGSAVIEEVSGLISEPVGNFVATILTYVVLFLIFMLVISLIISIVRSIFKTGPLSVVDKTLGLIVMSIVSIFVCCLVATVVSMAAPDFGGGIIYDFFRDFDPIASILSV